MERWRRVGLLGGGVADPVTAVLWLVRVEGEVRLLGVVAVVVVEVRVAVDGREICSTVTIVVRMWTAPYLALLGPPRRPFVLVGETMRLVPSVTPPLLLLVGRYPTPLIGEVAVVAPPTHVVMRVVAAPLGGNLSADRRRSLIGCSRCGAGLLDGSQSTISHTMWRSVTPGPFGHVVILQSLLLPEGRC